jgi:hypothetical protein
MTSIGIDFIALSWWGPFMPWEDGSVRTILQCIEQNYNTSLKVYIMVEEQLFPNTTPQMSDAMLNVSLIQYICNYTHANFTTPYANIWFQLNDKPLITWWASTNSSYNPAIIRAIYNDSRFETRIIGTPNCSYADWQCWRPPSYGQSDELPIGQKDGFIYIEPRYDNSFKWINDSDTPYPFGNSIYDQNFTEGLYDRQWNVVLNRQRDVGDIKIVCIYSWNSFDERSAIEPCKDHTVPSLDPWYLLNKTRTYITYLKDHTLHVGASYMTFWGTGMEGHDWSSGAAVYHPARALGNYNSSNVTVASLQIENATEHGIDFFFLDYGWGNDTERQLMEDAALNGLVKASEDAKAANFGFCIFYFPNWRVTNTTIDVKGLIGDFSHINDTYFEHPNYLRVDNRYVVILEDFTYYLLFNQSLNYEGINQEFSYKELNNLFLGLKENYSLYLIPAFWPASNYEMKASAVLNDSRRVYDAFTLLGDNAILDINATMNYSDYVSRTEHNFEKWNKTAASYGVDFVPLICPGYTRANNSVYYNSSRDKWWAIVNRDLENWSYVWQLAKDYANSSSNRHPMVLIFTWNDFNEGTNIESAMEDEIGSKYLEAIPEFQQTIALSLIIATTLLTVAVYSARETSRRKRTTALQERVEIEKEGKT